MEVICLDTSILIDHKNVLKTKKADSFLFKLSLQYKIAITVISSFELLRGDNNDEDIFWIDFFSKVNVLSLDFEASRIAGKIDRELIRNGKKIKLTDLFIGSIALSHKLKVATKDLRDFPRIPGLEIITQ